MPNNNTRTMAFQIDETLFQRIKAHLERETQRTGRKLTQKEFVLGLIEQALDEAERQAQEAQDEVENQLQEDPDEAESQPQEDPDEIEDYLRKDPRDELGMDPSGSFDD